MGRSIEQKTIRIYEPDWARLGAWQAKRAQRDGERPPFAVLIHEALDRLEAGGDM